MPTRTSAYRRDQKDLQKLFPENLVAEVEDKGGKLQEQDDGDAEGELVLSGFVVEQSHCPNCVDATADDSEEDKHRLRHSPAVVTGFPFVETVDDECRNVDNPPDGLSFYTPAYTLDSLTTLKHLTDRINELKAEQ